MNAGDVALLGRARSRGREGSSLTCEASTVIREYCQRRNSISLNSLALRWFVEKNDFICVRIDARSVLEKLSEL
jgi:hypothetical protein